MLENLKAWLNGTREYNLGVALYQAVGSNEPLKKLFEKGETLYLKYRLQQELLCICKELKKQQKNAQTNITTNSVVRKKDIPKRDKPIKISSETIPGSSEVIKDAIEPNHELYGACKIEADRIYKDCMNKRAVLFSMIPDNTFMDANRPDLIEQRNKLSIDIVVLYQQASKLYDRADYVKINGRLPNTEEIKIEESEYDNLPDHLVKQTLDNLRKNFNKMKKRAPTAERTALLQRHQKGIDKLLAKWNLLKHETKSNTA